MNEHEIMDFYETFFSFEDGKPTLWDNYAPDRKRAVCFVSGDGRIEIHTDPEIVTSFLDE